ncbi:MAG: biotin/lipoyl-binding protein, partial [Thermoguttaceae bacterium]|nr:biotin/lipoyl-binding protein [Thermoguttaceae bacterium]
MSKLFRTYKGTIACAVFLCACGFAQVSLAQMGGGSAAKSTVAAEPATLTVPTTVKKYVGIIEPIETVESVVRVSGDLFVAPGLKEGSLVKKGDTLFTIDKIRYQASFDAAQAALEAAKIALESANSELVSANLNQDACKLSLEYSTVEFNRVDELYKRNATSKKEWDAAQYEKNLAQVKLEEAGARILSAKTAVASAETKIASADAQLRLAEDDLIHCDVTAQIDGRIGRFTYTTGNYVTPQSQPLVTTVMQNPIYIGFTMSERDFTSLYGNVENLRSQSKIQLRLADDSIYDEPGEISFINNAVKT